MPTFGVSAGLPTKHRRPKAGQCLVGRPAEGPKVGGGVRSKGCFCRPPFGAPGVFFHLASFFFEKEGQEIETAILAKVGQSDLKEGSNVGGGFQHEDDTTRLWFKLVYCPL